MNKSLYVVKYESYETRLTYKVEYEHYLAESVDDVKILFNHAHPEDVIILDIYPVGVISN